MINKILHSIYATDLTIVMIAMPIIVLLWSLLCCRTTKVQKIINGFVFIITFIAIIYGTILSRGFPKHEWYLIPFSSLIRAKNEPEIYRSMLMNVLMFFPLGLSVPYLIRAKTILRILYTLLVGIFLSVLIEIIQFIFWLGVAETDDVICNTSGVMIGSCAYLLSLMWRKLIWKLKHRRINQQNKDYKS